MDFSVADVPMMRAYLPEGKTIRDLTDDERKLLVSRHQAILLNQQLSAAELRHTEFEARLRCHILDLEAKNGELVKGNEALVDIINRLVHCVKYAHGRGIEIGRMSDLTEKPPCELWEGGSADSHLDGILTDLFKIEGIMRRCDVASRQEDKS